MNCFDICFRRKPINPEHNPSTKINEEKVQVISQVKKLFNLTKIDQSPSKQTRRSKLRNLNSPNSISLDKSEKPLYELKDKFRCIFCGGIGCKHEDWTRNKSTAIKGLNCDKITPELFASQRPSTVLMEKYQLVEQFKELNIGLIVNVQRQGEHPYCGPNKGLELISGFTYLPESFTTEGIRVRLSGWKDMNVPNSIQFMLEIVKDMMHTVKDKKKCVLVHCHAGYGRTGIVLACFLIYATNKTIEEIVKDIRSVRQECIQKKTQLKYCETFKEYVDRAREIFTQNKKEIEFFIKDQIDLSFGEDLNNNSNIPKILSVVLNQIKKILKLRNLNSFKVYQSINGSSEWLIDNEYIIVDIKILMNKGRWEILNEMDKESDINILIELCYDWLEDCVTHVVNPKTIKKIFDENNKLKNIIQKHIATPLLYSTEKRKSLIEKFRNSLRLNEFETLTSIAQFAADIYPGENYDEKNEYLLMLEKLSTYLIGYNLDVFIEYSQAEDKLKEDLVDKLKDILMLLALAAKFDNPKEEKQNHILPRIKESIKVDNEKVAESGLNSVENSERLQNNIKIIESIRSSDIENDNSLRLSKQLNQNNNSQNEKEKEIILFQLYKSLGQYFTNKTSTNTQSDRENIKIINSSSLKNRISNNGLTSLNHTEPESVNDVFSNCNKILNSKLLNSPNKFKEGLTNYFTNGSNNMLNVGEEAKEFASKEPLSEIEQKEIIRNKHAINGMIKEIDQENMNLSLPLNNNFKLISNLEGEDGNNEIVIKKANSGKNSDNMKYKTEKRNSISDASLNSDIAPEKKFQSEKNGSDAYKHIRPKSRQRTNKNFQARFSSKDSLKKINDSKGYNEVCDEIEVEINLPAKLILIEDFSQE